MIWRHRTCLIQPSSAEVCIRARRKHVEVTAERGTIEADAVIVATESPLPDLRALRRHLRPLHSYCVATEPLPAAVRREVGPRGTALRDGASPPHVLRWLKDDRALFSGADQPAQGRAACSHSARTPEPCTDAAVSSTWGRLDFRFAIVMLRAPISRRRRLWRSLRPF